MHGRASLWVAVAAWLIGCAAAAADDCPTPKRLAFRVEGQIQRDVTGFTQGLELHGNLLFESTGPLGGATRLNTIDRNGRVTTLANYGNAFFGEGLTILGDRIFQLSWQDHKVFVYDLTGKRLREMRNTREGWGLTNDGTHLIFSDGGDRLYFADPATFVVKRSVQVHLGRQSLAALNELEYVDGKVYANVFLTDAIVRIAPESGCVEATADLSVLWGLIPPQERTRLRSQGDFVLNGIAYDRGNGLFYLTGKNWKTIFLGRFSDAE